MKRTMIVPSGMMLAEMPRENSVLELFALNFDFCEDFRLWDFGKGLRFFFHYGAIRHAHALCVYAAIAKFGQCVRTRIFPQA